MTRITRPKSIVALCVVGYDSQKYPSGGMAAASAVKRRADVLLADTNQTRYAGCQYGQDKEEKNRDF